MYLNVSRNTRWWLGAEAGSRRAVRTTAEDVELSFVMLGNISPFYSASDLEISAWSIFYSAVCVSLTLSPNPNAPISTTNQPASQLTIAQTLFYFFPPFLLCPDKQALSGHLLRLRQAHGREDGRCDITQDAFVTLLEAPALRGVRHNEGNLVGGVAGLGLTVGEFHLLSIAVIGGDEKDVALLLAGIVDLSDGLVGGLNTHESGLVHTSVADHVWRRKVVHDEGKLVLSQTLGHLDGHTIGRHLRGLVVGCDTLVRGHEILRLITSLKLEDLLDTTVEEESDMGVLFCLGNVYLLDVLLTEPLGEDITHVLGLVGNLEGVVSLVLGHGDKVDLGIGEIGPGRSVDVSEELGDLSDTVGSVVEEEDVVAICHILARRLQEFYLILAYP